MVHRIVLGLLSLFYNCSSLANRLDMLLLVFPLWRTMYITIFLSSAKSRSSRTKLCLIYIYIFLIDTVKGLERNVKELKWICKSLQPLSYSFKNVQLKTRSLFRDSHSNTLMQMVRRDGKKTGMTTSLMFKHCYRPTDQWCVKLYWYTLQLQAAKEDMKSLKYKRIVIATDRCVEMNCEVLYSRPWRSQRPMWCLCLRVLLRLKCHSWQHLSGTRGNT